MDQKIDTRQSENALAYDVAEARARVPLSRNAFYAAIARGEIESTRIGGKILIPRAPFHRKFGLEG